MTSEKVYAIGVSMTKFCRPGTPNTGYVQVGSEATRDALADAGFSYDQLNCAVISYCYGAPTCGQRVLHEVNGRKPTGIPVFNLNNNCSSASTALYLARTLCGPKFGAVLALGFEEMERGLSEPFPDKVSPIGCQIQRLFELGAKEGKVMPHMNNFTSDIIKVFAHAAQEYEANYAGPGAAEKMKAGEMPVLKDDWALVANKNHRHGQHNPKTMLFGKKIPYAKVKSEKGLLVPPITSSMSAPTANGAAACVLVSESMLRTLPAETQRRAVELAGQAMCTDLPSSFNDDPSKSEVPPFWALAGGHMAAVAADRALKEASAAIEQCGVIEVHDCFSPNEVFMYEAFGMCPRGKGLQFFKQGKWTMTSAGKEQYRLGETGQWVVNPSGGLESKGHPIGATGLGQCFEIVSHLRGEAGGRQVEPRPVFGLQHNFGFNGGAVVTVYKRFEAGGGGKAAAVPRSLSRAELDNLRPFQAGWTNFQEQDINLTFSTENGNLIGNLPRELIGTIFRNGPGIMNVGGTEIVHPIDGDGLIARVAFTGDGRAFLNTSFVQTFSHKKEQEVQKLLYPGQMGTRVPPENQDKKNKLKFRDPAHTNTYFWGGKLLACHEYCLPHVLNPQTLQTEGPSSLNEVLGKNGPMAAHFRIDKQNDRLVTFGFRPANVMADEPPTLKIGEVDSNWNVVKQFKLNIDGLNYSHDLAVTKNFYIFQMTPFVKVTEENVMKIVSGKEMPGEQMKLNPDLPCRLVVICRETGKVVTQRNMDQHCHIYHFGNAWETKSSSSSEDPKQRGGEGRVVHVQATCLPPKFNMKFQEKLWLSNSNDAPGQYFYCKIYLDQPERAVETELTEAASNEFPTIHPYLHCSIGGDGYVNNLTKENLPRYSYIMANGSGDAMPFNSVIKHDAVDPKGGRQVYHAQGYLLGEPVFAPRNKNPAEATKAQDDGWVIVQAFHPEKGSEFHVLDAKALDKGPIAILQVGKVLPNPFHGTWCDEVFAPLDKEKKIQSKL